MPSPLAANSPDARSQQHDTGRDQYETEKVDEIRDIEPSSTELEEPPGQVTSHHAGKQDRPDEAANGKPRRDPQTILQCVVPCGFNSSGPDGGFMNAR